MSVIEFTGQHFVGKTFEGRESRAAGQFSATEVRDICRERPGHGQLRDIRELGAPEALFAKLLEKRAAKIGFVRDSASITDAQRRAQAAAVGKLIETDQANDRLQRELNSGYRR